MRLARRLLSTMIFGAALTVAGTAPGLAQESPKELGAFDDWTAYTFGNGAERVCYVISEPTSQEGDYTRRGDPYFMVSHRPAGKVFGEASIVAGYDFQQGSVPTASIDNKEFNFTQTVGDGAWADGASQIELLGAMRRGITMVVTGTSSRGTVTTDTYSLRGITAAIDAIDGACK